MKVKQFIRDVDGASLVEFAVTAPLFFLLMFGIIQAALMLWAQVGLQHGTEAAARCASVSDTIVKNNANTNFATIGSFPTPCYSANGYATSNVSSLQSYAAANAFGFNPPASTFSVNPTTPPTGTPACTVPGNVLITASYKFTALTYLYQVTLVASSCFPTAGPD